MTVAELMEQLADLPADAEVRLAVQPRYPLECSARRNLAFQDGKVYIGEGVQQGYLSSSISDEIW